MTRPTLIALSLALAAGAVHAADMTEEQKTLYALGQIIAKQTSAFQLKPAELDAVQQGWRDGALGAKNAVDMNVYGPKVNELAKTRQAEASRQAAAKGKEYMAKAAAEKGAVKTPGGFIYRSLVEGKGAQPSGNNVVKVNYRGTFVDGTEFDSSYKRGEPISFPLGGVIPCWTVGLQHMKVGGKAKLTCPPELAYGRGGRGPIPPNSTLIFEVELLGIGQ